MLAIPVATAQSYIPGHADGFCIHSSGIGLPRPFLLIRKGNAIGALRIKSIIPNTAEKARAGEWLGSVSYETYFVTDSHIRFSDPAAIKRAGDLRFNRVKGFGFHYSWQSGQMDVPVGPWKLAFFNADHMFMTATDFWNGINHDGGFEFAPTGVQDIELLDPHTSGLSWFKYDKNANYSCPIPVPSTHLPTSSIKENAN